MRNNLQMTSSVTTTQAESLGYNANDLQDGHCSSAQTMGNSETGFQGQRVRSSPTLRQSGAEDKSTGTAVRKAGFQSLFCCVALGKAPPLPGSQLPHLQHGSWLRSFKQW